MRLPKLLSILLLFLPSFAMADALRDAENYLKRLKTGEARFVQIDPLGRVSNGIVIIDRPGKILLNSELAAS
jgi:Outer membrane lipoprotein-sorting protein